MAQDGRAAGVPVGTDATGRAVSDVPVIQILPRTALERELGLAPDELADASLGHALLNAEEFQNAANAWLGATTKPDRAVALVDGPSQALARWMERAVPAPRPVRPAGGSNAARPAARPQPPDTARARASALVHLLLNMSPGTPGSPSLAPPNPVGGPFGTSLAVDAVDFAITHGGADVVAAIFDPALEANGYISLSFAGLSRFVLVASGDEGGLTVGDPDGGRIVSIAAPNVGMAGRVRADRDDGFDGGRPRASGTAQPLTFATLVRIFLDQLGSLVVEPAFMVSVLIVGVLWVLWRLRRRRLEI